MLAIVRLRYKVSMMWMVFIMYRYGACPNPIPKNKRNLCEDLLKGLRAKTHIDYPSQKSDMTIYSDTRSVSLTLKYTLDKMNRKNKKEIDSHLAGPWPGGTIR